MLKGLARGILGGGADAVMGAVQNVVSAAIKKAKSLLGIASPSKVFREFGDDTGEGFALGVEDAAPRAQGLRRVRATAPLKPCLVCTPPDAIPRLRRVRATAPLKLAFATAPIMAMVSPSRSRDGSIEASSWSAW